MGIVDRIRRRRRKRLQKKYDELNAELQQIYRRKVYLLEEQRRLGRLAKKSKLINERVTAIREAGLEERLKDHPIAIIIENEYDNIREGLDERLKEIQKEYLELTKRETKIKHKLDKLFRKLYQEPIEEEKKVERPVKKVLEERKEERAELRGLYTDLEVNISFDTTDSKGRRYEIDFTITSLIVPIDITDKEIECIVEHAKNAIIDRYPDLDVLVEEVSAEDVNFEVINVYSFEPKHDYVAIATIIIISSRGRTRMYSNDFEYADCIQEELRTGKPRFEVPTRPTSTHEPIDNIINYLGFLRRF